MTRKVHVHCPECRERREHCFCEELERRDVYDQERARRGLVALYRPPSMRVAVAGSTAGR